MRSFSLTLHIFSRLFLRIYSKITTINHDLLTVNIPTCTRCKVDDGASHFLTTVIKKKLKKLNELYKCISKGKKKRNLRSTSFCR